MLFPSGKRLRANSCTFNELDPVAVWNDLASVERCAEVLIAVAAEFCG